MELAIIFVVTHAMGDGEDGPTDQLVELLASLRAIPGLAVLPPADANQAVEAYRCAMQPRRKPAAFVSSRRLLPSFDRRKYAPRSSRWAPPAARSA